MVQLKAVKSTFKTVQRNKRARTILLTGLTIFCLVSVYRSVYGIANSNNSFVERVLRNTKTPVTDAAQFASINIFKQDTGKQDRLADDATLREQLHFQFPYSRTDPIPKLIWQTWKYPRDDEEFSSTFYKFTEKWVEKNPDHIYSLIPDSVAHDLVNHLYQTVPQVLRAYELLPKPILKADFFRYLILFARGGIYSDVDTVSLKPASTWVSSNTTLYDQPNEAGLVVGIEADPDRPDWDKYYAKRVQFCQWTIQAKPGHPMLGELIARITEITLQKEKDGTLKRVVGKDAGDDIMNWTGPGIFTDEVFKYMNGVMKYDPNVKVINPTPKNEYNKGLNIARDGVDWHFFTLMEEPVVLDDVLVLPITGFSPGVGHMGSKSPEHKDAYVRHMFEGSWKPEDERMNGDESMKKSKKSYRKPRKSPVQKD
ncbi:CYFA0S05e02916g1_1 [Cyberlindnera fabianii]|uniref:CYFA0S05e02916g1_1 n=1 Tax=Cyberlindnera fabianii TaxID=36022 RepID=A0A061ASP4_CYBFA|nr:CYFA0S05e02916g1_1 [Cyberlindnera fabianii]